ncbi:MAG: helix-turn-helix domain-containing protein [Candidatus Saccharibacteria bacterium]
MTRDTQQHIFNSAKRIFAERGYDGLSMRTLAREVGISLSSIYHYHPDKDVLLKDIFDSTNTTRARTIQAAAAPAP